MSGVLLPVSLSFAGITDSTGSYTSPPMRPNPTMWATLRVVAQASGTPRWTVTVAGTPKGFARGPAVDPAVVCQPSQNVVVSLTGGQPLSQVTGSLEGVAGATFADISTFVSVHPNTIALDVTGTGTNGQQVSAATSPFTFQVAAGAISLVWRILTNTQCAGTLTIQGAVTLQDYAQGLAFANSSGFTSGPSADSTGAVDLDPLDTSLTITVVNTLNTPVLDVWTLPVAAAVYQTPGTTWNVSQAKAGPAPWQAPALNAAIPGTSVAASGTLAIIAGVLGKTVYLHQFSFSQDAANAAALWHLQDTSGALIADYFDAAIRHVFAEGDFGGVPLVSGRGVQMVNGGAAASFLGGYLTYSQQ